MYRVVTIHDVVRVPPKYFASELSNAVVQLLRDKYERNIDRDLGIILSVFNVREISEGAVIHGDGSSFHKVTFDSLVYYPEVNEVLDGEVTELVEFGLFVRMGPLEGLVHLSQITNDFLSYDKKVPAFIGKESKKTVKKGDFVRAKISTVSLKNSIPETKIGLTMRPEGLGKPEWITSTPKKEEAKKPEKKAEKKEKEPRQKRGD